MKKHILNNTKQNGATLIISLIMLMLLTLIGISGASNITLIERITGNASDKAATKQVCELTLREGEAYVSALVNMPKASSAPSASNPVWALGAASTSGSLDSSWMKSDWPTEAVSSEEASNASYFIEMLKPRKDSLSPRNDYGSGPSATYFYRTSSSAASNRSASTVCQSTYAKRFN